MKLSLDSRESKLIDILTDNIEYDIQHLPIGDILFEDTTCQLVVERKTWEDLWSSICDSRFREQRARMLEWMTEHQQVLYVIEGNRQSLEEKQMDTCRRALYRLMIAYRIPVTYTSSVSDTAEWIAWIYEKKDLLIFFQTRDSEQERIENIRSSKHIQKKDIVDSRTMLISFLRMVPGLSYPMAIAISQHYESLLDLVTVQSSRDVTQDISDIVYETPSKKTRKIGIKIAEKILRLLG